jgi:hypothetical protein
MPFAWSDGTCVFCHEGLNTSCVHGGFFGNEEIAGVQSEAVRVPPGPLGGGQSQPRIGKAHGPLQQQPCFFSLALQYGVYRPDARARRNSARRNVGMSLKWQLDDTQPVPNEDCVSVLPDVAERAKEVIPSQHRFCIVHVLLPHR